MQRGLCQFLIYFNCYINMSFFKKLVMYLIIIYRLNNAMVILRIILNVNVIDVQYLTTTREKYSLFITYFSLPFYCFYIIMKCQYIIHQIKIII